MRRVVVCIGSSPGYQPADQGTHTNSGSGGSPGVIVGKGIGRLGGRLGIVPGLLLQVTQVSLCHFPLLAEPFPGGGVTLAAFFLHSHCFFGPHSRGAGAFIQGLRPFTRIFVHAFLLCVGAAQEAAVYKARQPGQPKHWLAYKASRYLGWHPSMPGKTRNIGFSKTVRVPLDAILFNIIQIMRSYGRLQVASYSLPPIVPPSQTA